VGDGAHLAADADLRSERRRRQAIGSIIDAIRDEPEAAFR
jgi:hypothetical protein